jgi:excisionase family DNA binding protein
MQTEGTRMFRVKAVAEMFDVHPATIYRAIKAGELDAYKVGGSIRIPEWSLRVFREACAEAAYQEFVVEGADPAAADNAAREGGDVTVATVPPITARSQDAEAVR